MSSARHNESTTILTIIPDDQNKIPQAVMTVVVLGGAIIIGYLIARLANWCYSKITAKDAGIDVAVNDRDRNISKWKRLLPVARMMFQGRSSQQIPEEQIDTDKTQSPTVSTEPSCAVIVVKHVDDHFEELNAATNQTHDKETETSDIKEASVEVSVPNTTDQKTNSEPISSVEQKKNACNDAGNTSNLFIRRNSKSSCPGEFVVPDIKSSTVLVETTTTPVLLSEILNTGEGSQKELSKIVNARRGSLALIRLNKNPNLNVSEGARPLSGNKTKHVNISPEVEV